MQSPARGPWGSSRRHFWRVAIDSSACPLPESAQPSMWSASGRLGFNSTARPAEVSILSPSAGEIFTEDLPIPTQAQVSDPDVADPRVLDASWKVGGEVVAQGSPDADGLLELSLPGQDVGNPTLELVVTDGVAETAASVSVVVEPAPDTGLDSGL